MHSSATISCENCAVRNRALCRALLPAGLTELRRISYQYHSVDIDWMRRQQYLRTGCSGKLTWSRGGTATGNINYRVEPDGLRLIYKTRSHGGEWRDVDAMRMIDGLRSQS